MVSWIGSCSPGQDEVLQSLEVAKPMFKALLSMTRLAKRGRKKDVDNIRSEDAMFA